MPTTPQLDQYPVPVTSRPSKVAGYPGPFFVINSSTVATIWLADNSIVSDSHGIPLYPGTGMNWIGSQNTGELWAVLGTDKQSLTVTTVNLIVGAPVLDWQPNPIAIATAALNSGIILVDNPVQLVSSGFNGATTYVVGPIDVSTFQSISLQATHTAIAAHTLTITLNWFNSATNIVVAIDTFSWNTGDSLPLMRHLPCRASGLEIVVQQSPAAIGAGDSIYIMGSHRPYIADMSMPSSTSVGPGSPATSAAGDRVLLISGDTVVAPGAGTSTFPLCRYDGPAMCFVRQATANVVGIFNIIDSVTGAQFYRWEIVSPASSAGDRTVAIVLPRRSWAIRFDNSNAGNITMSCTIIACPEGV